MSGPELLSRVSDSSPISSMRSSGCTYNFLYLQLFVFTTFCDYNFLYLFCILYTTLQRQVKSKKTTIKRHILNEIIRLHVHTCLYIIQFCKDRDEDNECHEDKDISSILAHPVARALLLKVLLRLLILLWKSDKVAQKRCFDFSLKMNNEVIVAEVS